MGRSATLEHVINTKPIQRSLTAHKRPSLFSQKLQQAINSGHSSLNNNQSVPFDLLVRIGLVSNPYFVKSLAWSNVSATTPTIKPPYAPIHCIRAEFVVPKRVVATGMSADAIPTK